MISTSFGHCWIRFENGYTISIFNGSYSDNHKIFEKMQDLNFQDRCDSKDCEIAIIHDKLGFCTKTFVDSADSVIGFITPDELPELMMKVKEADNIEL